MKNGAVRKILMLVAGAVFLFSSAMVLKYRLELRSGNEYTDEIVQMVIAPRVQEEAEIPDKGSAAASTNAQMEYSEDENDDKISVEVRTDLIEDSPETEVQAEMQMSEKKEETIKSDRTAPIQVDFDALRKTNPDVVAWLYCPDTPINYPVVQASDNDYYLHRRLDGSNNYAGTIFMDFRNSADFSDWNTIIYGHNMRNDSMFGTLTDYKQKRYLEAHPEIYLLTPECGYIINILAGFAAPDDSEAYNALNPDAEEREALLRKWLDAAGYTGEDYPAADDRLVMLSTCSYEYQNARYVLMGTLQEIAC